MNKENRNFSRSELISNFVITNPEYYIKEFKKIWLHRRRIFNTYKKFLRINKKIHIVDEQTDVKHANWLFTIILDKKDYLQKKLRSKQVESNQVHFRNDRYSIFKKFVKKKKFKFMNEIENKYLVLPIHTKMKISF